MYFWQHYDDSLFEHIQCYDDSLFEHIQVMVYDKF